MKRVIPMLLILLFLGGLVVVPPVVTVTNDTAAPVNTAIPSQNTDLNVRVAIYDEDNTTLPTGPTTAISGLSNHLSEVQTILEDAGHEVTLLTTEDIENHELTLADYDVFVMVNNLPKDSIANLVKEFWLGGGGLLSFNLVFSYLMYSGIVWPEVGIDGYGILWGNLTTNSFNVTARHPTMKDYHINDTLSIGEDDWVIISETVFSGSPYFSYITPMMINGTYEDYITGFAMENSNEGGRLVHLPGDGSAIPSSFESIIVDSVEWLMPRPKGRIAFDLSHMPRIGVDSWDSPYITVWDSIGNFGHFRTLAVNHSYTFDKLYPASTGNLTTERLANYDILVVNWPDMDYTAAERTAVENWIEDGGSLLVLGDRTGLNTGGDTGDVFLNQLIQNLDMSLGTTDVLDYDTMTPAIDGHVTLEGCTGLYIGYRNYLVVIGNATEIWMDGSDCVVAAEQYGQGRVILSADMNIFDNGQLGEVSNIRFALNTLNWLSSNDAEILLHTDFLGWNDAVCQALRDLGLSYQPFYTRQYLDDFIDSKTWDMLIYNNVNYFPETTIYDELYAFVNTGGSLILTSFDVDSHPTHPLWSKMGVAWDSSLSGTPSMYFWDASHPIFTEPNNHTMYNYTSDGVFVDDGDTVVYFEGYTALAGTTATQQNGTATIVVSDDRKTLFNTIIIDNFGTDEDDSTYADSVELWQNEIIFMLTPPDDGGFNLPFDLDTNTLILIGVGVLALIIIIVLVRRRR